MARFRACCRPPLTPAALVLPQERTLWVSHLPEPIAFFDNKLKALFAQFGEVIAVTTPLPPGCAQRVHRHRSIATTNGSVRKNARLFEIGGKFSRAKSDTGDANEFP